MSGKQCQKNGGGGDSDSDSGCNLELTLGGSYGEIDDEMPVLTLSASVFEIEGMKEDSGGPNEEYAVERSFLSLRMSVPPAVPEMRTIKELQTMRRQEAKRRLMGKNRSRGGRPPIPNQSLSRILFPAISQPFPPSKTVPPPFRLATLLSSPPLNPSSPLLSPTPVSFFCVPPPILSTSSPPLSPMPVAFRFPTPPPPPPLSAPPQHSSLAPLCPMPLSVIRPRRQSSSPPLSPRPSSFRLLSPARPPLFSGPAPPANGEAHKMAIPVPESLPVEILRTLVVRWMVQQKYRRHRGSDRSDVDTGLDLIKQMPTVVATGAGPDGKRIEGFLCKFGTDEEVISLVCICHGMFFTPADFVKHAGGDVEENPMKQIIVCPTSF